MARHFRLSFFSIVGMLLSIAALAAITVQPLVTVDTFLLLATVASIVMLSRPSPTRVVAFWTRLMARTDDTVPRTT